MALRTAEISPAAVDMLRARLSELAGRTEFPRRALTRASPEDVSLAAGHDVYQLTLEQLAAGAGLEAAAVVGQRFLVLDRDRAIASAELFGAGADSVVATEGPFVLGTVEAIEAAEADPQLADGRYELRLLRVPAIALVALWLKDDDGGPGAVAPLRPVPPPLEAGRRYAPAEIMPLLATMARERLRFDDRP